MQHHKEKKIAWITGVNQGIGAAVFERFYQDGLQVVGFDRTLADVPEHLQPFAHQCDIRIASEVETLCRLLLPSQAPDIFVSVAGILHVKQMHQSSVDEWQDTFAVNLFGTVYFMQHLTTHFQQRRRGSIVFVSSNAAHVPRVGMAAYGASKAALTNMAKTLGLELAPYGVRVNSVSPGSTLTPMQTKMWADENGEQLTINGDLSSFKLGIPLQKLATVADITNGVVFMTSEQAGHITMHDLVIDGGATLGA